MNQAEVIVAVSTTLIAVVALYVSLWQGFVSRRHNRLSVLPHLRLDWLPRDESLVVEMHNHGIGPAVFVEFGLLYDESPITQNTSDFIRTKLSQSEADIDFYIYTPFEGDALAAGESLDLIILYVSRDVAHRRAGTQLLSRVSYDITYTSVYGQEFSKVYTSKHFGV